ncbi:hypothetical protein VdG2_02377 [Verticillium dahliae VDG2]|nr:hypothetical protein VdG2_02377 [Verticillium dahliae VDG2]
MSYRIAAPDEYLAITGMNVQSVKITKATWLWPFQRCMRFSVQPHDYAMNLQAMTKEKLIFLLPVVFTVGPDVNERGANSSVESHGADGDETIEREDRGDALTKYAMLLADADENKKAKRNTAADNTHVGNIVKGIIEGEVRVLVSSMTMEEIFTEREVFKRRIFKNIQSELSQFGLKIYNANVKELRDAPESNYFESLSRKAHEGASNQARIDVAEARLRGNVGEARRKEAAGMLAMAEAYGKMADAFGGPAGLLQYMMIEKGTYRELADANARAIHGLQPKISVWNTGSQGAGGGGGDASGTETMKNLYQMLPPLMTTINEQTGITLPEWQFGKMAAGTEAVKGEVKVNGKY